MSLTVLLSLLALQCRTVFCNDPWNYGAKVGSGLKLTCHDRGLYPFNLLNGTQSPLIKRVHWLLPACTHEFNRSVEYPWRLNDRFLAKDGFELVIDNVLPKYYGIYHCGVLAPLKVNLEEPENQNYTWFYIKRGLNAYGPNINDTGTQFSLGFGWSMAFLLSAVLYYLVKKYRYEARILNMTDNALISEQTSPVDIGPSTQTDSNTGEQSTVYREVVKKLDSVESSV